MQKSYQQPASFSAGSLHICPQTKPSYSRLRWVCPSRRSPSGHSEGSSSQWLSFSCVSLTISWSFVTSFLVYSTPLFLSHISWGKRSYLGDRYTHIFINICTPRPWKEMLCSKSSLKMGTSQRLDTSHLLSSAAYVADETTLHYIYFIWLMSKILNWSE